MLTSSWVWVYDSPWHNPGLFWLAGSLFFVALGARLGGLGGFLAVFGFEILADCALTGALSPLPPTSTAATVASIVFVILGDLRYFWLAEAAARGGPLARPAPRALALSLLVPIVSAVARTLWPAPFASPRVTFLVYEAMMLAVVAAHGAALRRHAATAGRSAAARKFLHALLGFELVQYGLWGFADVLLRAGVDGAYLLRLVPNTMYYALFLPFVLWRSRRLEVPA